MTIHPVVQLAVDGSGIDGSVFTTVTDFARDTRWLNTPLTLWTNAGLAVFAVLMLIGWWNARRRDTAAMALALAAPAAVVAAFAVAEVAKKLVAEVRPCYSLPHDYFVDACPARTDYAFPSGHSTTAFATVAALWLLNRRLSAIAAAFALLTDRFPRSGDHRFSSPARRARRRGRSRSPARLPARRPMRSGYCKFQPPGPSLI
jgi:undecaprenyl-diphosphatase